MQRKNPQIWNSSWQAEVIKKFSALGSKKVIPAEVLYGFQAWTWPTQISEVKATVKRNHPEDWKNVDTSSPNFD